MAARLNLRFNLWAMSLKRIRESVQRARGGQGAGVSLSTRGEAFFALIAAPLGASGVKTHSSPSDSARATSRVASCIRPGLDELLPGRLPKTGQTTAPGAMIIQRCPNAGSRLESNPVGFSLHA